MKRRLFILFLMSFLLTPVLAQAQNKTLEYEPGLLKQQLAAGKTVFVDYYTNWCGTCKRQARVIEQLRTANPAYNQKMVFMAVNWSVYEDHSVSTSRNIPRRSTLIVLRGNKELGRIVAGTSKTAIKSLMDKGLK